MVRDVMKSFDMIKYPHSGRNLYDLNDAHECHKRPCGLSLFFGVGLQYVPTE